MHRRQAFRAIGLSFNVPSSSSVLPRSASVTCSGETIFAFGAFSTINSAMRRKARSSVEGLATVGTTMRNFSPNLPKSISDSGESSGILGVISLGNGIGPHRQRIHMAGSRRVSASAAPAMLKRIAIHNDSAETAWRCIELTAPSASRKTGRLAPRRSSGVGRCRRAARCTARHLSSLSAWLPATRWFRPRWR